MNQSSHSVGYTAERVIHWLRQYADSEDGSPVHRDLMRIAAGVMERAAGIHAEAPSSFIIATTNNGTWRWSGSAWEKLSEECSPHVAAQIEASHD